MAASRDNSFGAFRLFFASLVIVSHSVQMIDGTDANEPMHRLFGGMSLGALAVDGFFLISGYLIAASFESDRVGYFWKRVLRIYPAFLVCSFFCFAVVAPLAGADLQSLSPGGWIRIAYRTLLLKAPELRGVFAGLPFWGLNGSMWSISYEFRCYIAAAAFGFIGLYRTPRLFAALTAAVIAATAILNLPAMADQQYPGALVGLLGDPPVALRLLGAFMTGTCFWRLRPPLDGRVAAAAGAAAVALQFVPVLAEPALLVLGGYVLFWAVFELDFKPLRRLNARNDISYGVYLYAWPAAGLLVWYWRTISTPMLILLTLAISLVCGALSWFLLEKPVMRLKALSTRWPALPGARRMTTVVNTPRSGRDAGE